MHVLRTDVINECKKAHLVPSFSLCDDLLRCVGPLCTKVFVKSLCSYIMCKSYQKLSVFMSFSFVYIWRLQQFKLSCIIQECVVLVCGIKLCSVCFQLTMNDFSVHRIIGRGGFGEVYGCRKADTGKMYVHQML